MMKLRYRKITVKIGSNVLTKDDGTLHIAQIAHITDQIAQLRQLGIELVLVSSGAVAAGRSELKLNKKLDSVSTRQLFSAVGQVKLINRYADLFSEHNITCAQVLASKESFADRHHYLNMKNCMNTLLANNVLPIVNENDTISVSELMFTDNDELSSLIASMQNSEALIILSNVDGIYDGNPANPESKLIEHINVNDTDWQRGISANKSDFGRGGMLTKSTMAQKLAKEGIDVHIANGLTENILLSVLDAEQNVEHTTFKGDGVSKSEVKKWIAHSQNFAKGELIINDGALKALQSDKATSLLLVGITEVRGSFEKGDIINILDKDGQLVGWGKANYKWSNAKPLAKDAKPIVHYDYLHLAN